MITVTNLGNPLWGRLGNQLFQIAAAVAIASENGHLYCFPKWEYQEYFNNALPEGYPDKLKVYKQKTQNYYEILLEAGNWDLQGFFQSEKFFAKYQGDIRTLFTPSEKVNSYIKEKYETLMAGETCSIHIRRGDYVKQKHYFPPQPIDYYNLAQSQFKAGTRFFVFSDDIEWCKSIFKGNQYYFVEGEKDILDLFLMSKCKHNIISNSSFSWWGAWLNSNATKRIIAPEDWFGPAASLMPKQLSRDIYAEGFEKLRIQKTQIKALKERLENIVIYFYCRGFEAIRPTGQFFLKNYRDFRNLQNKRS